ncbi:MAG: DUF4129 domain-containing protein [Timaviella obliquedivisa GSE-PSE-MK23-08B]|nr:DUF4129 domain-containing protein [Timaviella obliquedivisa GSE-PSE-MK23-08B]
MASGTFEKSSADWWIQQQQQQVGEWIESLFSGIRLGNLGSEDWALPEWFLQGFFWTVIVGVVTGLGWQLYQVFKPYIMGYLRQGKSRSPSFSSLVKQSTADWLERSRHAQEQGNYREACRSLYMASLQHLSDRNLVRQEGSRTDGEYLSLISQIDLPLTCTQPYQLLIRIHERLCFSDAAISAETFERCWQAYQQIQSL